MSRLLVSGATGFVGRALISHLAGRYSLIAPHRSTTALPPGVEGFFIESLDGSTDWQGHLVGVDCVIHLAARVHVMRETHADPLAAFREVNVAGTLALARAAVVAGVRRFVYLSSIKVNGEETNPGRPFCADDPIAPEDHYGVSKAEAETALMALARNSGLEVVIIRPPLVYGRGVKGNLSSLQGAISRGLPLPLAKIDNWRSLVGIDNLCSLIETCIDHPAAAGQIFLASDGEDISTTRLASEIGAAIGRPARLFPLPQKLICRSAYWTGKENLVRRLYGNLQVDIDKNRRILGWKPTVSVVEGFQRAFSR
ncbi:MAG: NAD-dependent epimerase/dehydratase family protein [Rhodocyclaceae bacterium]|nr:MAG: NAD-dependent epimerase/dehydratase family protein [Rhodocyclaceae bacterium]